ncbi:MAG: PSD1 domain-containing protein [Planctomyces sp.]|nr:PSD1 domain-containing protein [Planctomyces sp.]
MKRHQAELYPQSLLSLYLVTLRLITLCLVTLSSGQIVQAAEEDLFRNQVAPLLQRRCLSCHNSVDRKGDGSIETHADALATGWIEPGKPEESLLIQVLISEGDGHLPRMPKDSTPLSESQIETLRQWIREGAVWSMTEPLHEPVVQDFQWWAFEPIAEVQIPVIGGLSHPVDAFIAETLQQKNLQPSPEADRRTLIRRLTFDLTGLPPTPEEVLAFEQDSAPDAWERLIDRLLESPQYGERWARHWLDVVKYADTCGYDKDKLRPNAWPYRDYVIRAFNEDKSYPRFVEEQIAGDVLFPGEPDGIVGLGFIAAGPWDFIGHVEVPESKIDGKVARNLDRDDMVSNVMNTFCSVTIQCARCHNHKFDPFTQEHYYSMQSVFAAVDRAERPYDTDPETEQRRSELNARRSTNRQQFQLLEKEIADEGGRELVEAEAEIQRLKPVAEPSDKKPEYGYHSQLASEANTEKWVEVDLGRDTQLRTIVLNPCHDEFAGIGGGFGFPVRYRVEVSASSGRAGEETQWIEVADSGNQDVPNPGIASVEHRLSDSLLKDTFSSGVRYIRITATRLCVRQNDYHLALAEVQALDENGSNQALGCLVSALDSIEAPVRWSTKNLTDGIFPVAAQPEAAVQLGAAQRTRQDILNRVLTVERQERRARLETELKEIDSALQSLPAGRMVYAAATNFTPQGSFLPTRGVPREIRVLHRGQETQPTTVVSPGTIPLSETDAWKFSLPEGHTEGERRAMLAKWVTSDRNPLTWRSIVNRVWQYHFGQAIVDSPNDFGRMGQQPSHPALLDWLAADFRRDPSFKRLHRLMLTSRTYRQVAMAQSDNDRIDAQNRYLWRMNRRRLEAEELRDAVLAVSGKLNPEMGGPGYYLFELEKTEHSPHYEYHKFDPADVRSHRRSVYRFVVRSQPDPFMTTLDCADSSQSTPRRNETLTALQALSLLNSRFTTTMAESFAERLGREASEPELQVRRGFALVTGRNPSDEEAGALTEYLKVHGLPNLCRVLLNLSEFVFVE